MDDVIAYQELDSIDTPELYTENDVVEVILVQISSAVVSAAGKKKAESL
jgi:hypothetical protein